MSSKEEPHTQTTIKCEGCDTEFEINWFCKNINWFCKNCAASLCDACKTRHETDRFLSRHNIVPRTGQVIREHDSSKVTEPCPDHPTKEISGYCKDCDVPCCISCIAEKHRRHDVTTIEMKYMECEDKLNEMAIDIKKHTLTQLQSSVEEFQEMINSSEKKFEDVKKKINKFRQELKSTVDTACNSLVDEIDKKQKEQKNDIHVVIKELENLIKENELFISLCGDKIRKGGLDVIQLSNSPPPSKVQFLYISNISNGTPDFAPGRDLIKIISKRVWELRWNDHKDDAANAPIPKNTLSKPVKHEMSTGKASATMPIIDVKIVNTFDIEIVDTSVVPTGKGTAWVASIADDTMHMYDDKGKKLKSVTVSKGTNIWDIAVKRSGDIIVCNRDNKVRLVTANGEVATMIDTAPFFPKGVCLTEREDIVVCMVGPYDQNHVTIYSPDDKRKVKDITVKDSKGTLLLTNPYRVVMNGEDISVVNGGSNVVTASQDGTLRWVYDGAGAKLGKVMAAQGFCVDKFRNLFISDYDNHCVHYVDREGDLIEIILTREQHGIGWPYGIGVDTETGDAWVGSGHIRKIWVLQYLRQ